MKPYGSHKRPYESDRWKCSRGRADRLPPTAKEWEERHPQHMRKTLHFALRVEVDYDTPEDTVQDLIQDLIDTAREGVTDAVHSIELEQLPPDSE